MLPETLRWEGSFDGRLLLLDQRRLPGAVEYLPCETVEAVFQAIRDLVVRGAPAIGCAAAYGAVIAARAGQSAEDVVTALHAGADRLARARPTAVNLFWALDRMRRTAADLTRRIAGRDELLVRLLDEARAIDREDRAMCRRIGEFGEPLVPHGGGILTHCNAGSLATSYYGTALAVIYRAWEKGKRFTVFVDETRPVLQGARLTYWELRQAGVDAVLICDNMAGYAMQQGKVTMAITGADRIAANGDVANKIGTYSVAVLAKEHGIPFYVAAPLSTFDLGLASGRDIPIEERGADEVRRIAGTPVTVADAKVWSPAFDVTPAALIAGIVTDRGVIDRPTAERVREFFARLGQGDAEAAGKAKPDGA